MRKKKQYKIEFIHVVICNIKRECDRAKCECNKQRGVDTRFLIFKIVKYFLTT